MAGLRSMIETARTPLSDDEKGALARSTRLSLYVVAWVVALIVWAVVALWVALWVATIITPRTILFVSDSLGVTSQNASSPEMLITYWVAPVLVVCLALGALVVSVGIGAWRVRGRLTARIYRWADPEALSREDTVVLHQVESPGLARRRTGSKNSKSRRRTRQSA